MVLVGNLPVEKPVQRVRGQSLWCMVHGLGSSGSGFRVQLFGDGDGLGFRVWSLGDGLWFRVFIKFGQGLGACA